MMRAVTVLAALAVAGCATASRKPVPSAVPGYASDQQVPDYAKRPFEPFGRTNAVAIAEREWRAFGSPVDDGAPGSGGRGASRLDAQPGLWQRVGDYWWQSQDFGAKEAGWTGAYDAQGTPYPGMPPAWSAAFISYVMRSAGAGTQFTYSPLHADYINAAARGEGAVRAERPENYAARPGDLICFGRLNARSLRFDDLPASRFFGHCDIVVRAAPGQLTVIGGNVSAGVTAKHVPTTESGMLATPDGAVVDGRFPWFVVLRVDYAAN